MKRLLLLLLSLSLLLTACTRYWVKPGATTADFHRDNYACERESTASAGTPAYMLLPGAMPMIVPVDRRPALYDACMRARGWDLQQTLQTEPPSPAPVAPRPAVPCPGGMFLPCEWEERR